jgi:hypothetical protein
MSFLKLSSIGYHFIFEFFVYLHNTFLISLIESALYRCSWLCHFNVSFKIVVFQLSFNIPLTPFGRSFLAVFIKHSFKNISVAVYLFSFSSFLIMIPLALVSGSICIGIFAIAMFLAQLKLSFIEIP